MRPVKFKKWIEPKYQEGANSVNCRTTHTPLPGTNCWENDFLHTGIFHQWANACHDSGDGFGNYTIALVEVADGTVIEVLPSNLKFMDDIKC